MARLCWCGQPFMAKQLKQKFCSPRCCRAMQCRIYRRRRRGEEGTIQKKCVECAKVFSVDKRKSYTQSKEYCTRACQVSHVSLRINTRNRLLALGWSRAPGDESLWVPPGGTKGFSIESILKVVGPYIRGKRRPWHLLMRNPE